MRRSASLVLTLVLALGGSCVRAGKAVVIDPPRHPGRVVAIDAEAMNELTWFGGQAVRQRPAYAEPRR